MADPSVRSPRGALIVGAVVLALLVAALVGGRPGRDGPPLDPRSDGPLGTSALVAVLRELGAQVDLSAGLPDPADEVALLLSDRLDADQRQRLVEWVRTGGTLVVTDPGSPLAPPPASSGLEESLEVIVPGDCSIDALADLGEIDTGAGIQLAASEADDICFGDRRDGAFVVVSSVGAGAVVAVGGAAFVTNELVGEADNALLAVTLLAPTAHTNVRVVEAPLPAGGGDRSLSDLVPAGVKRALAQLAVAFLLYSAWRSIRLGKPVADIQPVEVAGSALVRAIGRMLARTRAPGVAAEWLRAGLRRRLRTRLAVPPEVPASTLAEIASARTGVSLDVALVAVGEQAVTTDPELVAVARAVASIHEELSR